MDATENKTGEIVETATAKRGRNMDGTPNREFPTLAKKVKTLLDGSTVWHIPVNDAKGERTFREETRPMGHRGRRAGVEYDTPAGRTPDATPFKVFPGGTERHHDGISTVLSLCHNDAEGNRIEGYVVVTATATGLVANIVDDKPETIRRGRGKTAETPEAPEAGTVAETSETPEAGKTAEAPAEIIG